MKLSDRIIIALIALTSCFYAGAQQSTTPYSMYGYGILNDNATSMQRQMGGIGYAMSAGRQVNAMNPASYATIDSLTFLWDIGADLMFDHRSEVNSAGVKNKSNGIGGGLDYITMQFPIGSHMGASVGLTPYSSVGYTFGDRINHGTLSNQGTGGITQAYAGVSGRIKRFSIGANVSYNFGNIINDVYAYTADSHTSCFEHVMQVRDWNVTIGAQYRQPLDRFSVITLGLVYSPKKSMHGKTWVAYWSDIDVNNTPADTVGKMKIGGNYYQPNTIGAGINYTRMRQSKLMVEADMTWQDWSKARFSPLRDEEGQIVFDGQQFNNRLKIALGGEYVPKLRGNYIQRTAYRLGAFYNRDYLNINGNQVRDFGLSCGVGLPTIEGKTLINIGFEWRHRQASPQHLIAENYYNITLGLNFNELWFWQRKIK